MPLSASSSGSDVQEEAPAPRTGGRSDRAVEDTDFEPALDPRTRVRDVELRVCKATVHRRLFGVDSPTRLGRFELIRCLGRGGSGAVFEARDTEHDVVLALKSLHNLDSASIYRLKREFRSLADVSHRNLVALHELFCDNAEWFFTMDLIRGEPFARWVRPTVQGATRPGERRLRDALRQLAEGVQAIHADGKVHCDLKPPNVLVTREERVVVLDFGMTADVLASEGRAARGMTGLGGTPEYMAPEQATPGRRGPATDWYAVGTMLFEALTGTLPFDGERHSLLERKRTQPAPDPAALAPGAPADLAALCRALLSRDPAARPDAEAVLGALAPRARRSSAPARAPGHAFVGRLHELDTLHAALATSRGGVPVAVFVAGPSGMGKSALLERFASSLPRDALVLHGRCYQQESVPYKGFDDVMDRLGRLLRRLDRSEVAALLPPGVAALCKLFPTLRRVRAIAEAEQAAPSVAAEPHERQRQAFSALKGLMRRLSERQPVVLMVDDLQWGDTDSARLLGDLLGPPAPPALLFVGTSRAEGADSSFFSALTAAPVVFARRQLELQPLSRDDARRLLRELSGPSSALGTPQVEALLDEAEGSPFLISELSQHFADGGTLPPRRGALSIDEVVLQRVRELPDAARRLLTVLSVAAAPLEQRVADAAAQLGDERLKSARLLRTARLSRVSGAGDDARAETYHDRVRDAVAGALTAAQACDVHRCIADALAQHGVTDPERLVGHLEASGQHERASDVAARAGHAAADQLAFHRAAERFEKAIALCEHGGRGAARLYEALGDARANAGLSAAAADAYVRAGAGRSGEDARRLRRLAAQQYLRAGRSEEGLLLVKQTLGEVGLRYPQPGFATLLSLLVERARLALAGTRPRAWRPAISPLEQERLSVLGCFFQELTVPDPLRGALFQTIYLRRALQAGDAMGILRGLAWEAINLAIAGGERRERNARRIAARVSALAAEIGTPYAQATDLMTRAALSWLNQDWRTALEPARRAEQIFAAHCPGSSWEQNFLLLVRYNVMEFSEDVAAVIAEAPARAREAHGRDDQFALSVLLLGQIFALLARDRPDEALAVLQERRARLGEAFDTYVHIWSLRTADVHIYMGNGEAALARMGDHLEQIKRTSLWRSQIARETTLAYRARAAALSYRQTPRVELREIVDRTFRRIRLPGTRVLCLAVLGTLAEADGDRARARRQHEDALRAAERAGYSGIALAVRRRIALLDGDEEGLARIDKRYAATGVQRPERFSRMLST